MTRKVAAAAALGILLTVSACGASASTTPSETSSTTPSPTASPSKTTASAAQFASVIAENEKGWRNYGDNITDCAFARVLGKTAADQAKVMACSLNAQTATITAQTAIRNLKALGNPPAEISSLVDRTVSALTPLGQIDAMTACKDTFSDACSAAETSVNGAIRPVVSVLDAWRPYTH